MKMTEEERRQMSEDYGCGAGGLTPADISRSRIDHLQNENKQLRQELEEARRLSSVARDEAQFMREKAISNARERNGAVAAVQSEVDELREKLSEAEAIIVERDDRMALVDRIGDLIGLPHDQELDQVAFELWFSENIGNARLHQEKR